MRGTIGSMKSFFSKLLPLLFIAMLSVAPTHAQAAGPTNGMFDCLGTYDWGCRVIGFLFQSTDNDLVYVKDGQPTSPEVQTNSIKALHAMMGFFSNALLIFASIKLLYELIQMTAESAQTGQVGGKDANKLWAPIRLVIAIGLLVPLDTGLNSGQYIVIQVAKWGSGMASQAWKVFTQKFADGQTLTTPKAPRVKDLAYSMVRSYACQGFINYYASTMGLESDLVEKVNTSDDTSARTVFKNKLYSDICGSVRYKVPLRSTTASEADASLSLQLSKENQTDFIAASTGLYNKTGALIQYFLPNGRNLPQASTENLDEVIDDYQKQVTTRVEGSNARASQAMQDILNKIQTSANSQGWTSAGTLFLDITRAQGQLITGALNIPEATGPNIEAFKNYKSAYADYEKFIFFLDNGARPQDSGGTAPITPTRTMSATGERKGFTDFMKYLWKGASEAPADTIFWFLDGVASTVGLWDSDPRKAFGDLGGSTNPFGEIAALGHKKIRLALNFIGYAIVVTGGGAFLGAVGAKVVGAVMGGLAALLMMLATLFLLAGVLLAYIVPMLPFTRFFFSILTWLGSLIEAMVLVPFMALAFLTPKGEGFAGPNTRNAFFLIFQLFLRPILCLFGLMCAMIMFYVAAKFLNAAFYQATAGVYDYVSEGSAMRFMQKLVYSVMYVGLIYSAANISFKMIEHIPKHALKWMGGSASEESYDDHNSFMGIATAVGGQQLLGQLQQLPQNIMQPITKGMEARSAGIDKAKADDKETKAGETAERRHRETLAAISGGGRDQGSHGSRNGGNNGGGDGGSGGGGRGGGNAADPAAAPLGSNSDDGNSIQQNAGYPEQTQAGYAAGSAGLARAIAGDSSNQQPATEDEINRAEYDYGSANQLAQASQQRVNNLERQLQAPDTPPHRQAILQSSLMQSQQTLASQQAEASRLLTVLESVRGRRTT